MPHALVTGVRSPLGWETSLAFARAGWSVTGAVRRPATQAVLEPLARGEDLPIAFVRLDLAEAGSIGRAAELATEHGGGRVDALVHLAEVGSTAAVEDQPDGELRRAMDVNFLGPLRLVRALLPAMRRRRGGAIVGLAPPRSPRPAACHSAFTGSKAAWEAACDALRAEVAGVGVSVRLVDVERVASPGPGAERASSPAPFVDEAPHADAAERARSRAEAVRAVLRAATVQVSSPRRS